MSASLALIWTRADDADVSVGSDRRALEEYLRMHDPPPSYPPGGAVSRPESPMMALAEGGVHVWVPTDGIPELHHLDLGSSVENVGMQSDMIQSPVQAAGDDACWDAQPPPPTDSIPDCRVSLKEEHARVASELSSDGPISYRPYDEPCLPCATSVGAMNISGLPKPESMDVRWDVYGSVDISSTAPPVHPVMSGSLTSGARPIGGTTRRGPCVRDLKVESESLEIKTEEPAAAQSEHDASPPRIPVPAIGPRADEVFAEQVDRPSAGVVSPIAVKSEVKSEEGPATPLEPTVFPVPRLCFLCRISMDSSDRCPHNGGVGTRTATSSPRRKITLEVPPDHSLERSLLRNSTLHAPKKTEVEPLPLVQRKIKSEIPPNDISDSDRILMQFVAKHGMSDLSRKDRAHVHSLRRRQAMRVDKHPLKGRKTS